MVLHFKVDGYRKRVKAHGARRIPLGRLHQPPGRRLCLLGQTFPQKKGKKPFGSPSLCSFQWLRRSSLVNSWTWRDKLGALSFWGSRGGGKGENVVKGFGGCGGAPWTLKGCRGAIECIVNHGDTMQIAQFKGEICRGIVSNWNGLAYRGEKWSTNFARVRQGWLAKQSRWQATQSRQFPPEFIFIKVDSITNEYHQIL